MGRFSTAATLLIAAVCGTAAAFAQPSIDPPAAAETQWRFTVPLQDGDLQLGILVGELAGQIGLDGEAIKKQCDYLVPIRTPLGSSTVQFIGAITNDVLKIELASDHVAVTVDRVRLRRQHTEFNGAVRLLIESFFPEAAALAKAPFGTVVHRADGSTSPLSADNAPRQAVVLIHGLDDVGHLWDRLTPGLLQAGYGVCEITYPDDQAIKDSSAFVASLLEEMREDGVERVSMVAHSMGSLIGRDLITNPAYYGGSLGGGERFPRVDRLILLGPPNHGSKMAMLHIGSEARDQAVRAFSGDGLLIGGFFDGAGQAQADLLPDSAFLAELNSRALPTELPVTIIAGSASPIRTDALKAMAERLDSMGKSKYGQIFDGKELEKSLENLVDGLGDGCVSLESAQLEGVPDFVVVEANHASMIKNYSRNSDRVPPAVPIILDRLARDRPSEP